MSQPRAFLRRSMALLALVALTVTGCRPSASDPPLPTAPTVAETPFEANEGIHDTTAAAPMQGAHDEDAMDAGEDAAAPPASLSRIATTTFAGGCFWCMEKPFDTLPGVISTTSGYTGGRLRNPTYEQVSAGGTGHAEAVQVVYDSTRVSYERLLEVFWHNIDPLVENRQFCDVGSQYRSAIYYHNAYQQRLAEASKRALEQSGRFDRPIRTQLAAASTFYPAEEYHQDFYRKNPQRYQSYRTGCGRDRRLAELWGDMAGH